MKVNSDHRLTSVQASHQPARRERCSKIAGSSVQLAVVGINFTVAAADGPVTAGAALRANAQSESTVGRYLALATCAAVLTSARICERNDSSIIFLMLDEKPSTRLIETTLTQ